MHKIIEAYSNILILNVNQILTSRPHIVTVYNFSLRLPQSRFQNGKWVSSGKPGSLKIKKAVEK